MKPLVKICGITNTDDAFYCAHEGADALGFIFYKQSPRYVEPSIAATIIEELPAYVIPVGVFVNESREQIERIISETNIRIIQLHGDEMPSDCTGYHVKVWKAFRLRKSETVKSIKQYKLDAVMLDGASDDEYGGSGKLANFDVALQMKEFHPVILSGGLNPDNVVNAIQHVQPYGIDISSGVESLPGKKDHEKVALLFERLHHFNSINE